MPNRRAMLGTLRADRSEIDDVGQASCGRVGVDVGGTKIAAGLVDLDGTVLHQATESTSKSATEIPAQIAAIVEMLQARSGVSDIAGVGIGAAGFISNDRSTIRFSPNIEWRDEPLGQRVNKLLNVPVVIENDANAAAWAEARFGAATDVDDVLLVTLGTGVGGGLVRQGKVVRGGSGAATEIGHLRVVPGGLPCGCGQNGCLEQYASGRALGRLATESIRSGDPRAKSLKSTANSAGALSGPEITQLARKGDELSAELIATVARDLGTALASLVAVLDPSVIVIGGGLGNAFDLLHEPLAEALAANTPTAGDRSAIDIRAARLGNQAGLVGAADLARVEGWTTGIG